MTPEKRNELLALIQKVSDAVAEYNEQAKTFWLGWMTYNNTAEARYQLDERYPE